MIFNKVKESFHEDPENIKKAVEAFSAQTEKLFKGNTQNMARALFTIGKEMPAMIVVTDSMFFLKPSLSGNHGHGTGGNTS